jgi:predicted dehydrogenase
MLGMWAFTALAEERSPAPPIKIGQIGVGHPHAKGQMRAHRGLADFEIVGVVEPDAQLRAAAQQDPDYAGLRWMTEEQLLNTPSLQGVLVETEIENLLDTAERCIAADKHIHLDKPAGTSLPQFERLLDQAAKKKLLVQMGYMYRTNPGVVMLREMLAENALGEVFEVTAAMGKGADAKDRITWAKFSGGLLFELGGHVVDVVVEILGEPRSVTPFIQRLGNNDTLADNMLAVLDYPRAIATVKLNAIGKEGNTQRYLEVSGTKGSLRIAQLDKPSGRLFLAESAGKFKAGVHSLKFPAHERYVEESHEMARVIRGEASPSYTYAHDLAVQRTLLQASGMPLT